MQSYENQNVIRYTAPAGCTITCCTFGNDKLRCLQATGRPLICLHSGNFGADRTQKEISEIIVIRNFVQ